MNITKKRTRDAAATRTAILEAAEELFAEKGFAGTSIREIAKKSGSSGPLILFHFNNKDNLFLAVKEMLIQRCRVYIPQENISSVSVTTFLESVVTVIYSFHRDNPTLMSISRWDKLSGDIAPWPGEKELQEEVLVQISQAQKDGELRDDIPAMNLLIMVTGAVQIWWEYHQHILEYHLGGDTENADSQYLQQLIKFVLRGVAPLRRRRLPGLMDLLPF